MSTWEKRPSLWSSATREEWDDWHWQQRHRVRSLLELSQVVSLSSAEIDAFRDAAERFRVAITPHYAALIGQETNCPVRLQCVPQPGELQTFPFEMRDPLAEESHMPVPGITHRYPDRVLFYVSHNCPVYCRHCTRKRKVANPTTAAARSQIDVGIEYIANTPAVRDVVVSGGDPLSLSDERLDDILGRLRAIPHVEVVRLGTRNPVTLPQRITPALCEIIAKHGPIYVHTHFNHPNELVAESERALNDLRRAGAVLGNQLVLLRGVNDDPDTVMDLNRRLLQTGCRPYYILQCDMAEGITHFRTPLSKGLEVMDHLRGRIGGMGVPHFVVDLPGGGGKIELVPDYLVEEREGEWGREYSFRNAHGETYVFVDAGGD